MTEKASRPASCNTSKRMYKARWKFKYKPDKEEGPIRGNAGDAILDAQDKVAAGARTACVMVSDTQNPNSGIWYLHQIIK